MNRRKLFAALAALPFIGKAFAKEKLPEAVDILRSFDARDWAKHFIAHVKVNPEIPLDEETMLGWFANALMRGYDERQFRFDRECDRWGKTAIQRLSEQSLRGAVARGWCSDKNTHKEMDCDLAEAIVQELMVLSSKPHFDADENVDDIVRAAIELNKQI